MSETLTNTTIAQIIATLPHALGFTPAESIITVPLLARGQTRKSPAPFARVDIPGTPEDVLDVAVALTGAYTRNPVGMLAIVAVSEDEDLSAVLLETLAAAFTGITEVVAVVSVNGPQWTEVRTLQHGTITTAETDLMAAEFAFWGKAAPVQNREQIAASLISDTSGVEQALVQHPEPAREYAGLVEQFLTDGLPLSDSDTAALLLAVAHKEARDDVAQMIRVSTAGQHVALWQDITRRAPESVRTPAAALLGLASWIAGDGARAWCALDLIPESESYPLRDLIAASLQDALPPQVWEEIIDTPDSPEGI